MKRIKRFVAITKRVTLISTVISCLVANKSIAEETDDSPKSRPCIYDSNAVARAKEVLAFEAREKEAPRYRSAVTNWNPVFRKCDGITNIVLLGGSGSDYEFRAYRGSDGDRWIDIRILSFKSSRDAHEHLIKMLSSPAMEVSKRDAAIKDKETTDPKEQIGFRCFRGTLPDVADQVLFIRNNFCISLFGKGVKVSNLARELDRQIVEVSEYDSSGSK